MKSEIELLKNENKIMSFYTNDDETTKFGCGIILSINDELVLFKSITPFGEDDGIVCLYLDDIYRLNYNDKYDKKIAQLYSYDDSYDVFKDADLSLEYILQYAKVNNYIVEIELFDSGLTDVTGYVDSVNDDNVIISSIDEYGEDDGKTLILIDNITCLSCNSMEARKLQRLNL